MSPFAILKEVYMSEKIGVLIVDDMESFQVRFHNMVRSAPNINLLGIAKNGYEAILKSAVLKPDVILMDIMMEQRNAGIEASKEILKLLPKTQIIITSVIDDDNIVYEAFQAGITNYLLKKNSSQEVVLKSIEAAFNNQSTIRPEIANKIKSHLVSEGKMKDSYYYALSMISKLTPSEIEIISLLYLGYTKNDITEKKHIAFSTVKTHVNNILTKMNKDSTKELIIEIKRLKIMDILEQIQSVN
jgi:DNA-binding NarL/FixJ family response regulator